MADLDPALPGWAIDAAAEELGRSIVEVRRVAGREGGYGPATRRVLGLDDGTTVFLKFGGTRRLRSDLRHERDVYDGLRASFMIDKVGAFERPHGVGILLDNCESAAWPPPWMAAQIAAVTDALAALRMVDPPPAVDSCGTAAERLAVRGWASIADDLDLLIDRGIATRSWLDRHLDLLVDVSHPRCVDGDALVHFDLRSDNLCFVDGSARIIDWASARIGHRYLDQHYWATTLLHETGIRHDGLLADDAASHLALLAALFVRQAGATPVDAAGVAQAHRAEAALRSLLPWMCDLLGIEPPDGDRRESG